MNRWQSFSILFFIGFLPLIMVLGNSMFIPLIPTIEQSYQVTTSDGSLFLSLFSFPAALLVPFSGILSDRFGRRKVALVALLFIMAGTVISSVFRFSYELVLIGRLLQGIGAGGVAPLAMTFVADLYKGEERNKAFGFIELTNGIGKVLSPIIGSVVLLYGWEISFLVLLATSLFAFIGIQMFITNEMNSIAEKEHFRVKYNRGKQVFTEHWRWLLPIFFSGAIGMFLLFGYLYYLTHAYHSVYSGVILAIPLLIFTLSTFQTGRTLKEKEDSYKRGMLYGFGLMIIGTWSMLLTIGTNIVVVSVALFGLGFGILLPSANAALASVVSKKERGTIFSLYSMVRFLGIALSPVFFGIWMSDPVQMVFTSLFFTAIIGLTIALSWTCFPIGKSCMSYKDLY